jgi:hypothetical protein
MREIRKVADLDAFRNTARELRGEIKDLLVQFTGGRMSEPTVRIVRSKEVLGASISRKGVEYTARNDMVWNVAG